VFSHKRLDDFQMTLAFFTKFAQDDQVLCEENEKIMAAIAFFAYF
jgi:hypothetical protein